MTTPQTPQQKREQSLVLGAGIGVCIAYYILQKTGAVKNVWAILLILIASAFVGSRITSGILAAKAATTSAPAAGTQLAVVAGSQAAPTLVNPNPNV